MLRRLYFRTFQLCLRMALPFLPYRDPKILSGISSIPDELKRLGKKSVFVVSDEVLTSLGLVDSLKNVLEESGIKYYLYSNVVQNPTTSNVEEALVLYKENACDSLIALGGGSVIDCAKAIGARVARPKKSLGRMAGILKVMKKIPTLFAIPTTAGTGSETTLAAVIVDSKTRHKYAINDFPLIPRYAVLDEELIMGLPKHITATTGMDALTHAIEAYIGRGGNRKTRSDALEACRLILSNLEVSYNEGTRESKRNMLYASHLAGRAFSKAYVGNVHSIAHSLGGKYNIAHGYANAVILPRVLEKYGSKINKKMYEIATYCGVSCSKSNACLVMVEIIDKMNASMGIVNGIHVDRKDIDELANYAYHESNPLYPVPVIWSKNDFKKFYEELFIND